MLIGKKHGLLSTKATSGIVKQRPIYASDMQVDKSVGLWSAAVIHKAYKWHS